MTGPALRTPARTRAERHTGPFPPGGRRRYTLLTVLLVVLAVGFSAGILAYDNPMPLGTDGFWRIAAMRAASIAVILVVAFCHAIATVSFQTATGNRILTPSIMGVEALYLLIQTSSVFLFGVAGLSLTSGTTSFLAQTAVMVLVATLLYGSLLAGRRGDLHTMLLVGVILGGGLGSLSTFMQRLLTPSEFDILTARLFGNIGNADVSTLPYVIPLAAAAGGALWWRSGRLDVLALGRGTATNLGLHHTREVVVVLFLVSVLMAMTTSLVGPMTFLGFLVAMLAYQLADTSSHRLLLPMAFLLGYVVLSGAYFVLRHVFYAQGMVTIIIELVGGLTFLLFILRKGRL